MLLFNCIDQNILLNNAIILETEKCLKFYEKQENSIICIN